jgi:hypothetical protein
MFPNQLVQSQNGWQFQQTSGQNQKLCMVNIQPNLNQSNRLYAVPISNNGISQNQQMSLSADLNSIEPTLPIESNLTFKNQNLVSQVSSRK